MYPAVFPDQLLPKAPFARLKLSTIPVEGNPPGGIDVFVGVGVRVFVGVDVAVLVGVWVAVGWV